MALYLYLIWLCFFQFYKGNHRHRMGDEHDKEHYCYDCTMGLICCKWSILVQVCREWNCSCFEVRTHTASSAEHYQKSMIFCKNTTEMLMERTQHTRDIQINWPWWGNRSVVFLQRIFLVLALGPGTKKQFNVIDIYSPFPQQNNVTFYRFYR